MRALLALVLLASFGLSGCTLVGLGVAADSNRQRRAEATTEGTETSTRPPVVGDMLNIRLTDGTRVRGAFASLSADSLTLAGNRAFALRDIDRVERPWTRANFAKSAAVGLVVDVIALGAFSYSLDH